MSRLPGIAEIFKAVDQLPDPLTRQQALGSHWPNKTMLMILQCFYDPSIQLDLPPGVPPYTPAMKSLDLQGSLYREMKKLYIFEKNSASGATKNKKEQVFLQMLEMLDPEDALLMLGLKDKKMPYKNITEDLVRNTFPDLLPKRTFPIIIEKSVEDVPVSGSPILEDTPLVVAQPPPARRKPGPKPKQR